jgi:ABC-type sugar transport system ATPase subunit
MIAGFIRPDAGVILIDGARVNELSPQRRRIGLVLQDYAVFTRLTVRANLAFGLHAKGLKRSERRSAVDGLARLFNLVELLDRRSGGLNMSEMQRVALARTLGTQPELLLLDEPMSNLDAEIRAHLRGELRQLQKSLGQTVLYVTHDQAEALSMSDRIAVMRDGKIVQVASPDDTLSSTRQSLRCRIHWRSAAQFDPLRDLPRWPEDGDRARRKDPVPGLGRQHRLRATLARSSTARHRAGGQVGSRISTGAAEVRREFWC